MYIKMKIVSNALKNLIKVLEYRYGPKLSEDDCDIAEKRMATYMGCIKEIKALERYLESNMGKGKGDK